MRSNKIGEMIREKTYDGDQWTGRYAFEGRTELAWLAAFNVVYSRRKHPDIFRRLIIRDERGEVGHMWPSHADEDGHESYDLCLITNAGLILARAYQVQDHIFAIHLLPNAEAA